MVGNKDFDGFLEESLDLIWHDDDDDFGPELDWEDQQSAFLDVIFGIFDEEQS